MQQQELSLDMIHEFLNNELNAGFQKSGKITSSGYGTLEMTFYDGFKRSYALVIDDYDIKNRGDIANRIDKALKFTLASSRQEGNLYVIFKSNLTKNDNEYFLEALSKNAKTPIIYDRQFILSKTKYTEDQKNINQPKKKNEILNNVKLFFGKINDRFPEQLTDKFYRAPKNSSWFNGIDVGDYAYIFSREKTHLWKAREWKEDGLYFDEIIEDIGIYKNQFCAFKYFKIDVTLAVLTVRPIKGKAFFQIELEKPFPVPKIENKAIYNNPNHYREIYIHNSKPVIETEDEDIHIYLDENKLKLFESGFLSSFIIENFRDNRTFIGQGRGRKDRTIQKLNNALQNYKEASSFLPNELSIRSLYDAFCVDYSPSKDEDVLLTIIEQYKQLIQVDGNSPEKYKWKLLGDSSNRFNMNAANFVEMIKSIDFRNLLHFNSYSFIKNAGLYPDEIKKAFEILFDERKDLKDRIIEFQEISTSTFQKHVPGYKSQPEERALATYLTYFNPSKYTFYKDSFYSKLVRLLNIEKHKTNDKYIHYLSIVDEFIEDYIKQDQDLINQYKGTLEKDDFPDPNFMLLAQDIFYRVLDGTDFINDSKKKKIWRIGSSDDDQSVWKDMFSNEHISIGWPNLGDLDLIENLETYLRNQLSKSNKSKTVVTKYVNQILDFHSKMQIGDIVIVQNGYKILGIAEIIDDYKFNVEYYFPHTRSVKWLDLKEIKLKDQPIGVRTTVHLITDQTTIEYFLNIKNQASYIEESNAESSMEKYWWLQANAKAWNMSNWEVGQLQHYTLLNERGNKRRIYKHFQALNKGDKVIGYQSSPTSQIVSLLEVDQGPHERNGKETVSFKMIEHLTYPVFWSDILSHPELKECEVLKNNQGSLFSLSQEEYDIIIDIIDERNSIGEQITFETQTKDSLIQKSGLKRSKFEEYVSLIKTKKQVIFQGAPGTGKSHLANIFQAYLTQNDPRLQEIIQFHPTYSYEDFIEGYRPTNNGNILLQSGVFKEVCRKARMYKDKQFVLIIDEINRGNLSKIFGELLFLLEYRNRKIKLTYSPEESFYIPENVIIIGTMNTADRSLALVDFAYRRRFKFISLKPDLEVMKNHLSKGETDKKLSDSLHKNIGEINKIIREIPFLGDGFEIGHSYFMDSDKSGNPTSLTITRLNQIWNYELEPLLQEYFFEDKQEIKQIKDKFFDSLQ